MHSRNTTASDALHQAALNVKNTNNLPTDLRHAQLQPSGTSSTTTGMGTSGSSSGPVFHEQPRETMSSGASSHLPRAIDKDRDGRPDILERDRNNDGIADRNQNLGTSSHLPRALDKDQNGQLDALQRGHQSSMGTSGSTGMTSGMGTTGMHTGGMTSGMGMGQTKTTMTVESVARDAQSQIDAQVAEALAKSRQLNAQDQARLQQSIGSATASLEEQARQLKAQIDEEKLRAEEHVRRAQQEKLTATAQRQAMEEKAILEAAAARKIELEQKALRLQQEIEEITRRKTAEMMAEKPGNLQFVHQHQDTAINAQLAGDIGHALDIQRSGRITETTTGGEVQYHPVQVQTMQTTAAQQARAAEQTIQGPAVHQQHGGVLHAMKTFVTGESTTGTTSGSTTGMKQAPVQGTRAYDEQSQWANQSDKLASK